MRHYEIVMLIHPDQSDQIARMIDRYRSMVTDASGTIHRLEEWGRRQLAYPIQKLSKAFYVMMNIECEPETLAKLKESLQFNDAVLRWEAFRCKQAYTEDSPILKARNRNRQRDSDTPEENDTPNDMAPHTAPGAAAPGTRGLDTPEAQDTATDTGLEHSDATPEKTATDPATKEDAS